MFCQHSNEIGFYRSSLVFVVNVNSREDFIRRLESPRKAVAIVPQGLPMPLLADVPVIGNPYIDCISLFEPIVVVPNDIHHVILRPAYPDPPGLRIGSL